MVLLLQHQVLEGGSLCECVSVRVIAFERIQVHVSRVSACECVYICLSARVGAFDFVLSFCNSMRVKQHAARHRTLGTGHMVGHMAQCERHKGQ